MTTFFGLLNYKRKVTFKKKNCDQIERKKKFKPFYNKTRSLGTFRTKLNFIESISYKIALTNKNISNFRQRLEFVKLTSY